MSVTRPYPSRYVSCPGVEPRKIGKVARNGEFQSPMVTFAHDPASIAGKSLDVAERIQLLVIGAGPAGLAAALEGARNGLQVILVDENPIPAETMGEDIPLLFGQRATGAVRNRNAMMETVVESDPDIAEAFEAGVDVRLGVIVWGLYANGPTVGWLPGPVAGVADGERSWLVGCDRVIVAAGRRDMGLGFPGWNLPGVTGATAAHRLATQYGALDARRAVVLGSTAEALASALALREAGVDVAAVVERSSTPVGPVDLLAAVALAGISLHCGQVVGRAEGDVAGVEKVVIVRVDEDGRHERGSEFEVSCDTVVLGVGAVPSIELLSSLGCKVTFQPDRGGYVPLIDEAQRCSTPGFYAVGDGAGVWPAKSMNSDLAREEGRRAARDAAAALGLLPAEDLPPMSRPEATYDLGAYRLGWVRASVVEAESDVQVCRCEEVTAREILEVRPPRYLEWEDRPGRNDRDLRSMLGDGVPHPDQVKRLTRAGMGLCQGRRCREQVQALLALGTGFPLTDVPLASYRAPVRPLSLRLAGQSEEALQMAQHWDTWFGMASQYTPHWEITQPYTAGGRNLNEKVASE